MLHHNNQINCLVSVPWDLTAIHQVKTSDTIDSEISALMDIHSASLEKKQQKAAAWTPLWVQPMLVQFGSTFD
ncbi:hypothetical protein AMECASPLE_010999 [Ameca splendens]|uniref:Uncharacterized protein n=1 Tax=Ameca splendens TaxID=208324 RepID=A0ABV0XPL0_9TELE